jgi:Tol biopolymer transport system component
MVVSVSGGRPKALVATEGDQRRPAWTPDGAWITYVRYLEIGPGVDRIAIRSIAEPTRTRFVRCPGTYTGCTDPSWSPGGRSLAVVITPPQGYGGRLQIQTVGAP